MDKLLTAPPPVWTPQRGKQTQAYYSLADELFYGGAGGGGKSDLLLGLAGTAHRQSIIFRRVFPNVRGLIERSREIFGQGASHARDSFNEALHIWRFDDGRTIEFASMQHDKDKENYRGRPHDGILWDELPEFLESQFRFVNAWNRTTRKGQRCRILATGNPPTSAEGEWVIRYWAPWLDTQHPNPAQPGELRWFAVIDGKDKEVESGAAFEYQGETIYPRSRTFIPARLEDNPIMEATGYRAVLQGLPEPLRSQLLYGDFSIGVKDDAYQAIPTAWVRAAIDRWKNTERPEIAQTALGGDVARGGDDKSVLASLRGVWFDELRKYPGAATPDGQSYAALTLIEIRGNPVVGIDVIGIGSSAYDQLKDKANTVPVNFGEGTTLRDNSGRIGFVNVRAAAIWKFREALDPQVGANICLPDDPELVADLTSARWGLRSGKIYIESKEEIKERIHRSPDCGDAVVIAWWVLQSATQYAPSAYAGMA